MFVPHNRDSKPMKHCTGHTLLHETSYEQNTWNNGFQALDTRQQRIGSPEGQEMNEVSPVIASSTGPAAGMGNSGGAWWAPRVEGTELVVQGDESGCGLQGRCQRKERDSGDGQHSPSVSKQCTDQRTCVSLGKEPPKKIRGNIIWGWYKTRNSVCSPDRKTS